MSLHLNYGLRLLGIYARPNRLVGLPVTLGLLGILLTWIQAGVPLTHPYRIMQGFIVIMGLSALATKNMRAHLWIAVSVMLAFLAGQVVFRLIPGLQG